MSARTIAFGAILATTTFAATIRSRQIAQPHYYCPTVDSANEVSGAPWQAGVSVPAGGTIQVSESHEVGYSWTIGGDLGIGAGDIVTAGAGFGFSVSESVSDAVEEAGSLPCPDGPWRCGLVVTPGMVEYHGHLHEEMGNDEGCGTSPLNSWENEGVSDNDPFVIQLPKKDPQGNGYFTVDVCVCDNLDGWDAEGHPEILCPEDCVTGA